MVDDLFDVFLDLVFQYLTEYVYVNIHVSLLGSSLLHSFSEVVDCILVILCFPSSIHLLVHTIFDFLGLGYLTQDCF